MLHIREPFQSRVSVVEQPFLTNLRTYNFTNAKHGTSTCIVAYTHSYDCVFLGLYIHSGVILDQ